MFMMYGIITAIIQPRGREETKPCARAPREERKREAQGEKRMRARAQDVPRGTRNALTLFYTKRRHPLLPSGLNKMFGINRKEPRERVRGGERRLPT